MLHVSWNQNNFQDNLGIIIASISYITTRARHVSADQQTFFTNKVVSSPLPTGINNHRRAKNTRPPLETEQNDFSNFSRKDSVETLHHKSWGAAGILLGRLDLFWF